MDSGIKTIPAECLYLLREGTGFISGQDLHQVFEDLCGKPSPSGYVRISLDKLRSHWTAPIIKEIISSVKTYRDAITSYTDGEGDQNGYFGAARVLRRYL